MRQIIGFGGIQVILKKPALLFQDSQKDINEINRWLLIYS